MPSVRTNRGAGSPSGALNGPDRCGGGHGGLPTGERPSVGAVLWDFNGTLATREGGNWAAALIEVLDAETPGHSVTVRGVKDALAGRLPWDRPFEGHPQLCDPRDWWDSIGCLLSDVLAEVNAPYQVAAPVLAGKVRSRYLDPAKWRLITGAEAALAMTQSAGWANVILSNHVPELTTIVAGLALTSSLTAVVSSAMIGYEKPHPRAFAAALRCANWPQAAWVVGDDRRADAEGAERIGVPWILIDREAGVAGGRVVADPLQAAALIAASTPTVLGTRVV